MSAARRTDPGTRGGPDSLNGEPGSGRDCRNRKREAAVISKVLMRLYPGHAPSSASVGQPNGKSQSVSQLQAIRETSSAVAQPLASSSSGLDLKSRNTEQNDCNRPDEAELNLQNCTAPGPKYKEAMPHQKIYTVSLPPDDYIPGPQNDNDGSSSTENSDVHEDIAEIQSVQRRKRRRQRKKENVTSHSSPDSKFNLQPTQNQPSQSEGVFISKNKRRKLQRKRRKERLKVAGLWPKTNTAPLPNQSETNMEDSDLMEQSIAQNEEEIKKTEDLLDFLQATQEIYFTESKSRCADSALSIELVQEIMNQIKNGAVPFSELCLLHQLKGLLLLQDIERLKDSLDHFKEHSSMPPGHILVLHSLFCYWISDILPIKIKSTS